MKGLSIEEKAKAYDKAIERAKSKIKNDKDHVLYEDDIIEIFPELKESEDEGNEKIEKSDTIKFEEEFKKAAKEVCEEIVNKSEPSIIKKGNCYVCTKSVANFFTENKVYYAEKDGYLKSNTGVLCYVDNKSTCFRPVEIKELEKSDSFWTDKDEKDGTCLMGIIREFKETKINKVMKVKELMIGDWFHNNYTNENYQVWPTFLSQATNYGRRLDATFEDINITPIPLTPEILEKNGFICDGWSWWYLDFRIVLSTSKGVSVVCGRQKRFEFVHELQHALRLCGIEKEIEL